MAWNSTSVTLRRLHRNGLAVILDDRGPLPTILHWGVDPGPDIDSAASLLDRPGPPSSLDVEPSLSLVPSTSSGFAGRPGIECHRSTGPVVATFDRTGSVWHDARLEVTADDRVAGVGLAITIDVGDVVEVSVTITNLGTDPLIVDHAGLTLPLPESANELLRFSGQWCQEFQPQRLPWSVGAHLIESRRGRTSHDSIPVVFVGPQGFGGQHGDVHGIHLAWSGNHSTRVERLADGRRFVQAGELLFPGEVVLAPGDTYTTPAVLAAHGVGLDQCSHRFHRHVRRTLPIGTPPKPRPVLLNTWEAVYFDHDLPTLRTLADRAAAVGVERFVLDDGWFGGRRTDTAGLGDWWVSPEAHPNGLAPIIRHVTDLGMDFGIWVEPEMVNPDSDLYRAHPDWVLGTPDLTGRNQLVLDLSIGECWQYLFDHLDRLLADHAIAFVKWDHNRDLAGTGAHLQTRALYRLLDSLHAAHPTVEFESCASGGGRADAEILRRTARIWTSDCNDPRERQTIQAGFTHFLPPEVMGAHIGPPRAHTTGRRHRLAFRAATAMFGHLGIEWNLLDTDEHDLDKLRAWITLHKELRPLLHSGDVVRLDLHDPTALAHGVVAADRTEAVFCLAQLDRCQTTVPPRLVLAGLDPARTYRIERIKMPGDPLGLATRQPAWTENPVEVAGRVLMTVGLQPPIMLPESALLIRLS